MDDCGCDECSGSCEYVGDVNGYVSLVHMVFVGIFVYKQEDASYHIRYLITHAHENSFLGNV